MTKIRLGGIKILEGRSHLKSFASEAESALSLVCSQLSAERINLNFLTHLHARACPESGIALCLEGCDSFFSYSVLETCHAPSGRIGHQPDTDIVSIFPHHLRPAVTGALFEALAARKIPVHGAASSPSALSVLISDEDRERFVHAFFDAFDLSGCESPIAWYAAYQGREEVLKEIICSYEEEVIKVYNITSHLGLDLWNIEIPVEGLKHVGRFLTEMEGPGATMAFLVAQPRTKERLRVAFTFEARFRKEVTRLLEAHLPGTGARCESPVAVLFLHGPHFGDRYGIVHALVSALQTAAIPPLGISCAISSLSVAIPENRLEEALGSLRAYFHIP